MWLRIIRDIEYFLLDANYSTLGMCPKVYPRKLILREVPHEKKKSSVQEILCATFPSCVTNRFDTGNPFFSVTSIMSPLNPL